MVLPCQAIGSDELGAEVLRWARRNPDGKAGAPDGVPPVQVVPASQIRARRLDSPEAARREMSASLAFEGSFLRDGKLLRVNYALVDTITLSQLDAFPSPPPTMIRLPFRIA